MASFFRRTAENRRTLRGRRQYVGSVVFYCSLHVFLVLSVLAESDGFLLLSSQLAFRKMYPTVPLSSSPSKEAFVSDDQALFTSPFFWSCERTADEIARHMTDAILSAEHTLTPRVEIVSSEPPLTILHNFLSPSDIEAILKATQAQEMQRSTMGATQQQAEGRTSSTAWLAASCCQGPLRRLADKTSRTVQLHSSHMENLQVVRYSPGQEFTLHTDHLDSFNDLECRGRLATCLIYLQTPQRGGETSFPEFEVDVPRLGFGRLFFPTH